MRVQLAIVLFTAAYMAEIVRGGLAAIPRGQYEVADQLGMGYWQKMGLVILPQALKTVIPPTINMAISTFKDTSLVVIVSLYDLLMTTKAALRDTDWLGFSVEGLSLCGNYLFYLLCQYGTLQPIPGNRTQPGAHLMSEHIVIMEKVNKWFDQFHVLKDINLQVASGEKLVVCGPSGSGKSTLIRCLNRLEAHQSGRIKVGGVELNRKLKNLQAVRAEIGMVFQHFNLFSPTTRFCKTSLWRPCG